MIKVLAFCEAGIRTGFERVARHILNHLDGTGDFDITVMGIGYTGQPDMRYPWPVYSASLEMSDQLGTRSIDKYIKKYKPDVVWILHDLWQINTYMAFKQTEVPVVVYAPVDTPNMKWNFVLGLGAVARAAVYTQFGAHETAAGVQHAIDILAEGATPEVFANSRRQQLEIPHPMGTKLRCNLEWLGRYQNPSAFAVVPHGLDQQLFAPMDKVEARRVLKIPQDAFVVGNINANQMRKRQDIVIRAFAQLVAANPKARLIMHCAGHTISGWDLEQLCRYFDVHQHVWRVHEDKYELSDAEVVALYNACDVMINPAGGEGWGMTSMEGASCGIPQILTDWGPTKEIWENHAVLLPVQDYRMEPKFLNTCHAEVNVKAAGDVLVDLWQHPEKLVDLGQKAKALAERQWTWPQVGAAMERVVREAALVVPPRECSLATLYDMREAEVRSVLRNMPVWTSPVG